MGGCDQGPAAARIVIQVLELADGLALGGDEATRIWPTVDPAPAKHTCPVPDAGPSMRQASPLPLMVEAARPRHQAATSRGNAHQAVPSATNVSSSFWYPSASRWSWA